MDVDGGSWGRLRHAHLNGASSPALSFPSLVTTQRYVPGHRGGHAAIGLSIIVSTSFTEIMCAGVP